MLNPKLGHLKIVLITILIFTMVLFSTNVYSETVEECEDRIRSDDSLTYAEKTVALKKCDDAEKDYSPYEEDPAVDVMIIRFCEDQYDIYELIGKDEFLKMNTQVPFAIQCVILYPDPIWEYEGDDRVEVLANWLEEETQKQFEEKAQKTGIPEWVRNTAKWWSEGSIDDRDFVGGIQYLIKVKIMKIPETTQSITSEGSNEIPYWIKNNAEWWSQGLISDDEFVKGIQYLVQQGIIKV